MARRLTKDVYSQTINRYGEARQEGWLPAGTVVEPAAAAGLTDHNRADGIVVRIVRTADGRDGNGLAREVLQGIGSLDEVSTPCRVREAAAERD